MRINRKLIKNIPIKESIQFKPFSIIITFSHSKINELKRCLFHLNECESINFCELILVLYENEYKKYDFSNFKNLSYKIIWSKRNNNENKFCLSHARNIGLLHSSKEWVLMLDGDIICPQQLVNALSKYQNYKHYIYTVNRYNISNYIENTKIHELEKFVTKVDNTFLGYFHFYHKKTVIDQVGGYDESMIGWGREDCDFIQRCQSRALIVRNLKKEIIIYHLIHEYSKSWKDEKSDLINHNIQIENHNNKKIKMENIGKIIN